MNKSKRKILAVDALLLLLLLAADQLTKRAAVLRLKGQEPLSLIDGVFELRYLENRGAAFGLLQGQKAFFILAAVIILFLICYVLIKMPLQKKFLSMHILLTFVAAGAVGNMIDRVIQDYVVDFFYISLINFPIFNMADIYVSISCVILAILFLTCYKEEDFAFLSNNKVKRNNGQADEKKPGGS